MKAITYDTFGDPSVLKLTEIVVPTPTSEQLLVKVHATALNRADTLQRRGKYPPPPGESDILGLEIAGEVVSWGNDVEGFKKGDRVFALVGSGGYAECCVCDAQMAMRIPDDMSYQEAAAIPEVFLTANEAIMTLGELRKNETVLIHAGASGVGTAILQMAKNIGAKVFFTARSDKKVERVLKLGADYGINYKVQGFVDDIAKLTNGEGVDVIIDFVGAPYLMDNLHALKTAGRLIQVSTLGGAKAEINLVPIMQKRLQIKGLIMRSRSLSDKRIITQRFMKSWLIKLANKEIYPIIDSVFPLEKIAMAHEHMEANLNVGKIVISI